MNKTFPMLFFLMLVIVVPCHGQNLVSLQLCLSGLGYSIDAYNDILPGELYFQRGHREASIESQSSSLSRGTAFGWYNAQSSENWLIGGSLTGLPNSARLPDLDGIFGFNIWTNYNGQERPEMDEHWFTETILNRDLRDHVYAYQTQIDGHIVPFSYILAWEDWANGDWDYEDMIVRVDGVEAVDGGGNPYGPPGEVPEPCTIVLFGLGLVCGGMVFKKHRSNHT